MLTTVSDLQGLEAVIPAAQLIPLRALAGGGTVEEAWEQTIRYLPAGAVPDRVDPADPAAAMQRSPGRFVEVTGPEELRQILARPFRDWRRFLHPTQQRIAYHPYHSPVHGGHSELHAAATRGDELEALTGRVRSWLDAWIEPHATGVAARSRKPGPAGPGRAQGAADSHPGARRAG